MTDDAAAEFVRLFKLVDDGVLPESAIPRMAYVGHRVLGSFALPQALEVYRCVTCCADLQGTEVHVCTGTPETHCINRLCTARWECCSCRHVWDGEDGVRCPVCKACTHTWPWEPEPDGSEPCVVCGEDKRMSPRPFSGAY